MSQSAVWAIWILTSFVGLIAFGYFFAFFRLQRLRWKIERTLQSSLKSFEERAEKLSRLAEQYLKAAVGITVLLTVSYYLILSWGSCWEKR